MRGVASWAFVIDRLAVLDSPSGAISSANSGISVAADTLVSAHPNAGLPNEFGGYDDTPDSMAARIGEFARSGLVNIVGGCCGTTPAHVRALVQAIREGAPQAKVIWASTTPVLRISETTDELDPELNPVVVDHNAKAAPIMAEYKIPTNDLYTLMLPHLDLRGSRKDNYHWSPAAYELMAKPIVELIERELPPAKK